MRRERVRSVLDEVAAGSLPIDAALDRLSFEPLEALPFATIDHHRALRQGFPEVVYAPGKQVEHIVAIVERIAERGDGCLVTRADQSALGILGSRFPGAEINSLGRTCLIPGSSPAPTGTGTVLVVTAGTSDLPVAEEAAVTADALGNRVARITDVGVAGLHRVLGQSEALQEARAIIVVAGMDGALPSVIGGLVRSPVIAVPTSVGYGAAFGGLAALLSMLNSCASGVTVVNIDNGFGAAVAASRITHS